MRPGRYVLGDAVGALRRHLVGSRALASRRRNLARVAAEGADRQVRPGERVREGHEAVDRWTQLQASRLEAGRVPSRRVQRVTEAANQASLLRPPMSPCCRCHRRRRAGVDAASARCSTRSSPVIGLDATEADHGGRDRLPGGSAWRDRRRSVLRPHRGMRYPAAPLVEGCGGGARTRAVSPGGTGDAASRRWRLDRGTTGSRIRGGRCLDRRRLQDRRRHGRQPGRLPPSGRALRPRPRHSDRPTGEAVLLRI